ncbi:MULTISPECIES: alpha-D-ribose 1-methylphosphonate 5-triphosphate diphosphatase [unclassified Polaromonas]|jgi:alpha-D-ribose 1-methylphosphonate 5-triphosphate diphosphatase|uniref:alpha-D-ribose 1-methylphosphonate 5-triphosphate diphosphatase n=1 Tax=unclassified Polaromonas TaxID=2638319 RepID=UPI0018C94269|nr:MULTISPECIES: alpha-D-ribose 1-methylphosphonate 5-triphosphate diphosphatase [unclassified Polaromonas]MBG6070751.1 alpha-D-ribose 1-methylphosphonate 5-triphosphate diphosphatase [Polaromonas sp. CG_9.7]MBG6112940.1 alpha-D-ribose 1-methylphosphonate 5-triphosphate diphosphatase [Polaromonas sp. CG_9.2]MDH6186414.1 alpha-D-ribose 1-methylphosphonate 5-triphosphate diphosphatase [Polaromonas sp. CG_23.6]
MTQKIIKNAKIVTATEEFTGCMVLEGGIIRSVERGGTSVAGADDWAGDWLLPGLVELHTDNLEKHLMPRPGVLWNAHSATVTHDAQCAAAGITTVLDSIVIGNLDGARSQTQHMAIQALHECRDEGLLRVEHLLHLRCEVSAPDIVEVFARYADDALLELVSVMDHTPGQRQWRDLGKYRHYTERNGSYSDADYEALVVALKAHQARYAIPNRAAIVAASHARNKPLASHDDTDVEHVEQAGRERIAISEFPTTVAAAQAARQLGIAIVMGGPNLVKGGSHSGNVSAAELAQLDLLDIFSSDYVPASLLQAAFLLRDTVGWSLPKAINTITRNPARAIGLTDRGELAPGLRADLIRVRMSGDMPIVRGAWHRGERAF